MVKNKKVFKDFKLFYMRSVGWAYLPNYCCHCEVPTIHDLCTYDQYLMCCPVSGSAITTSCATHTPRNDMINYTNIVPYINQ